MSDDATPVQCRACGGIGCAWCGGLGVMSPAQVMRWHAHKPRTSTAKFDAHRAILLERLLKAWDKLPLDVAFGEMLVEALEAQNMVLGVLRTVDDKRLAEIVEHYVLLGKSGPG